MIAKEIRDRRYTCNLTEEIDKHLIRKSSIKSMRTYLQKSEGWSWIDKSKVEYSIAIRYPGATRGAISFEDDGETIKNIYINPSELESSNNNYTSCYKDSVLEAVKQFIGQKIIFKEEDYV